VGSDNAALTVTLLCRHLRARVLRGGHNAELGLCRHYQLEFSGTIFGAAFPGGRTVEIVSFRKGCPQVGQRTRASREQSIAAVGESKARRVGVGVVWLEVSAAGRLQGLTRLLAAAETSHP
jgi:hypothetical protein